MTSSLSASVIKKFPKQRPDLPEEYQRIYQQHYLSNREGNSKITSLSKKVESWMHVKVAEDVQNISEGFSTLELGAGTLNHLAYEKKSQPYDVVEPFKALYEKSQFLGRVRQIYRDSQDIQGQQYDRIISIATFEHIMDLPVVVAKAATLLNPETGRLRIAIPNEGTFMWWLGTQVTGFEFKRRYGLDYQVLMKYEHVNTADEIEGVLDHFFSQLSCSFFGVSKTLAFYRFYDCRAPRRDQVAQYLSGKTGVK